MSSLIALGVVVVALATACGTTSPSAETTLIVAQMPLVDGERYVYALEDVDGERLGTGELVTRLEGSRWVLEQRYEGIEEEGRAAPTDVTELAVDATTMSPFGALREAVREEEDGDTVRDTYDWIYTEGDDNDVLEVERDIDGRREARELDLRPDYYDNESSLWLWRTLDFDEELDLHYVSVNPIERTQQTVNIQSPARETIELPAGTFEAWRVIVRNGRAIRSAWINVEAPHQLLQWDNGDLIFRLEESTVPPNEGGSGS